MVSVEDAYIVKEYDAESRDEETENVRLVLSRGKELPKAGRITGVKS